MVVVFLTHNYPRHPGDLPGAFLHSLGLALRNRGHDVRVVAPADRGSGGREPLDGIPVRRVRYASPERETLAYTGTMQDAVRSPGGLLRLTRLIRALRRGARAEVAAALPHRPTAALIHAHWWFPAGWAAPRELPTVVTLHGTDGRLLGESALARWLARPVLRRARVVTAVSPELAGLAERTSARRDIASHVQPMPVDASGWPWSRGGAGLLVVARLTTQKRVQLAIRAAGLLSSDGTPIPLTIVGDGPERSDLEALAAIQKAPIRFLGALPHPEVVRVLEGADAMLFTARQEGFGLAPIEALMMGVPVVACDDGGGIVSAIGRHGGGIVGDCMRWNLARAAREAMTPAMRDQARDAGARWRTELAPARVAERFEAWYGEALAR
ncbi:MAG TPA: glycosyltransferase family 4 protein [Gemmatimonadales bacterium]|nr:glycosyltransferase family 4 protein [Gemmatimonadales bacterium]